jgi:hypothetical protein
VAKESELQTEFRRLMQAWEPRDKVHEDRLRRMAKRQGLTLTKTRRRDPRALDYGCFWLNDARNGARVFGGEWGAGLDEIEAWLLGYEKALPKHKRKAARGQ